MRSSELATAKSCSIIRSHKYSDDNYHDQRRHDTAADSDNASRLFAKLLLLVCLKQFLKSVIHVLVGGVHRVLYPIDGFTLFLHLNRYSVDDVHDFIDVLVDILDVLFILIEFLLVLCDRYLVFEELLVFTLPLSLYVSISL